MHRRIYYNVGSNVYKCLYMRQITWGSPTAESYSSRTNYFITNYSFSLAYILNSKLDIFQ